MKLPIGGRALLTQREQGMHPARVWLLHGSDHTRKPRNAPCLCIGPDDDPARFDWSVVAGVPVHVVAREGYNDFVLRTLIAVARHAEPVVLHCIAMDEDWPHVQGKPYQADAAEVFFGARRDARWPHGWTDDLNRDYERRKWIYFRALAATVIGEVNSNERRCA